MGSKVVDIAKVRQAPKAKPQGGWREKYADLDESDYEPPSLQDRDIPSQVVIDRAMAYLRDHEGLFGDEIPTPPGLADALEVPKKVIEEWVGKASANEKCAEFAEVYERMMNKFERLVLNGGILKENNPQIASLALQTHFKYSTREQVETDQNVRQNIDINDPEELNRHAREFIRGGS